MELLTREELTRFTARAEGGDPLAPIKGIVRGVIIGAFMWAGILGSLFAIVSWFDLR